MPVSDDFTRPDIPQYQNTEPLTAGLEFRLLPLPVSHRAPRRVSGYLWALAWLLGLVLAFLAGRAAGHATSASAATTPRRLQAFYWARTKAGDPYQWGASGPNAFDCSGLVYAAYRSVGISLPRTTYEMIAAVASGRLSYTNHPAKGDLAFYGSGHVELYTRYGHSFGALETGKPVWWHREWPGSWWPTFYLHVTGSG